MSSFTYYHNHKCTTSRRVLSFLNDAALTFHVRDFLIDSFTVTELELLIQKLNVPVMEFIREKEASEYQVAINQPLSCWPEQIIRHPRLLQRPILSFDTHALICRPYKKVFTLFNDAI